MPFAGELAALTTAVLWAANAVFFTESARRIDALSVSILRLIFASVVLAAVHLALGGRFSFPLDGFSWLAVSGIVALAVGDWFLFAAFGKIGPRIVMLVMSLSPVFAAVIDWIFRGEILGWMSIAGIVLTVGGIIMVVLNKKSNQHLERKELVTGVIFALVASLGQGTGMVLGDEGMESGIGPLDATMIRVVVATVAVIVFVLITGKTRKVISSARNLKAMLFVFLGTTFGLIGGTFFMFLAFSHTKVGIAATLLSISPLFLLPTSRIIYKERITLIAVIGTVVTLTGVALLLLM